MNRSTIPALLLAALALPSAAKEISPQEALRRASADSPALMARGNAKGTPRLVHTALTEKGAPAVYVFNSSNDKGFLLLSADDAALPVLGYSDESVFSSANLPPQLQWWLGEYARQIEYARQNGLPALKSRRSPVRSDAREAIAPQIKTKWDQIEPYNDQCPLMGTERTWTGCVATAMAQVMNYWQYPEKGEGSITYSIESLEKKVTMNFSQKKFDWENMLDVYLEEHYDKTQSDAVAYLMKACGYATKMQYSMDASGALALNIGKAFTKYFKYDPNLLYTLRQYYSSSEWEQMIYDNLKNVGPLLYGGGSSLGGGHSFVCDGYDGQGLFHFNWGWSGMSDGYFSLDALNPDALGTGGGSGGGYNFTQDAVFGIRPPTGAPAEERPEFITQEGELSGSIKGSILSFALKNVAEPMWVNYNGNTVYVKFGAMLYPQGDTKGEPVYHDIHSHRFELLPGYGTNTDVLKPTLDLSGLNLGNGTYKVVVGTVEVPKGTTSGATDGEGFVAVVPNYGSPNYITLNVADGKYTVVNHLLPALKVKGEIIGGLYFGCLNKFRVTVENPSDIERVSGFAPVFMDEEGPLLLGESIFMTIPPNSTVTQEWDTDLVQFVQYIDPYLGKDFIFTFFNEDTFDFYLDSFSQTVTLNATPAAPVIGITKALAIENSGKEGDYTIISNPLNIHLTGQLRLLKGSFRYPVVACLCEPATDNQVLILTTASQNMYLSTENEESRTGDIDLTLNYPLYSTEQTYIMVLAYNGTGGLTPIANLYNLKFADISGVAEIESNAGFRFSFDRNTSEVTVTGASSLSSIEAFDAEGRKLNCEAAFNGDTATMTLTAAGINIICLKDASGKVETFKIIK